MKNLPKRKAGQYQSNFWGDFYWLEQKRYCCASRRECVQPKEQKGKNKRAQIKCTGLHFRKQVLYSFFCNRNVMGVRNEKKTRRNVIVLSSYRNEQAIIQKTKKRQCWVPAFFVYINHYFLSYQSGSVGSEKSCCRDQGYPGYIF